MVEISFFWWFALCALAMESVRSLVAMRKQAQASLARFDHPGAEGGQELFHNQMEQTGPWTELQTPVD